MHPGALRLPMRLTTAARAIAVDIKWAAGNLKRSSEVANSRFLARCPNPRLALIRYGTAGEPQSALLGLPGGRLW